MTPLSRLRLGIAVGQVGVDGGRVNRPALEDGES
jgi:hypothetical protein